MTFRTLSRTWRARVAWAVFFSTAVGAGPAAAAALLSEVYYDAPGSDDGAVFVELSGPAGFVLDGWVIEGVNGSNGAVGPSIPLSGAIGADGLFVLADRFSDGTTGVANADLLANFDFQNGPDSVVLRDAAALVRDALGYGVFDADEIFAGEGSAAPDGVAGESLARVFADLDTDDNALDFVLLSSPTPGEAPFAVVPEPATGLLMALGLAGLSAAGRPKGRWRGADVLRSRR
ncbi:MAG: PEP-CTERM sorting domain-containing protein [bacterium]|nr:PEP-CTERM sorting domain-containing protein [bacterium]